MGSNKLIVIAGPTAIGKTSLSIALAKQLNTEIISFDSRQIYKELSIGTDKPEANELAAVKHHFINHISIHQTYNAFQFETEALTLLQKLFKTHKTIVAVGGTGLYLQSLTEGLDDIPKPTAQQKESIQKLLQSKGRDFFIAKLQKVDPDWCTNENLNNTHRFLRAIEVLEISGKPISFFYKNAKSKRNFTSEIWVLNMPREQLYERINQRVDAMIDNGLEEEIKSLDAYRNLPALNTIAYKEWWLGMSKKDAIAMIKQNSRRYAKRQITWFKKYSLEKHLDASLDEKTLLQKILTR